MYFNNFLSNGAIFTFGRSQMFGPDEKTKYKICLALVKTQFENKNAPSENNQPLVVRLLLGHSPC